MLMVLGEIEIPEFLTEMEVGQMKESHEGMISLKVHLGHLGIGE